jgi:hypothetical protein
MPIRDQDEPFRDQDEPEEPQADAGLLEFIDRRRGHQAQERRRRIVVSAIAALAVIAIALAFSNIILLRRFAARPEAPPAASVASVPAPAASPTAAPAETLRPAEPAPPSRPAANMVIESTTPALPTPTAQKSLGVPDSDSARRTARWLVQTHGRVEAENRVAKVAEFYRGEQNAYWRRVLLAVRQEPEP